MSPTVSSMPRLVRDYVAMLREEPRARAYLWASLVDDVGVAISAWAGALMMTELAATQRARASFMLPTLVCFFAGALVSGPLADWTSQGTAARLARWRYKVVLAGRAVETVFLGVMVYLLATGAATIGRVLPYLMASAFMKTALRPTRLAFAVDLLDQQRVQHGLDGAPLRDENGAPLLYKTHLVSFTSATSFLAAGASFLGLLLGNRIMAAAGGRGWLLFLADVLTNGAFVAVVAWRCHPDKPPGMVRLRDVLPGREPRDHEPQGAPRSEVAAGAAREWRVAHFGRSLAEGVRFLAQPAQRPLLALLAGTWLVEVVNETYDGPMVLRHVLHAGTEGVRHAAISWRVVGALGALALPLVVRRVGSLGRIFLVTMAIDGLVIALAGQLARAQVAAAALPFVAVIAVDHTLTLASGTLASIAQNSVSSAAMRGRIAGTYALVVILGDMGAEALATVASERWGIPGMLVRIGFAQVALVALVAALGGKRLWRFGLRPGEDAAAVQAREATGAASAAVEKAVGEAA